jgi:coenzyme F420-reducing hydrogenase gamma subunit
MTGHRAKPRVGIFGLTGCAGDQLQILNCEDRLVWLAGAVDIVDWVMARSENDHSCGLDVAFVEGVVATERDLEELKKIRARAAVLVALGTCAVWGGIPAMRNGIASAVLDREASTARLSFRDVEEALPAASFVDCDYLLPGCPIEGNEFLLVVYSLLRGTVPELPAAPVCWECKVEEYECRVLQHDEVCCGAMTRGGCGARCPSHGVACAGCRGPVEEPNYDANISMFEGRGLSWMEISDRMRTFSAPVWMRMGLEGEKDREQ